MVNYSNGKIYKIVCDTTGLVYIGSTTKQYLSQRLDNHRSCYKGWKDGKLHFITAYKVLENNNYNIVLLELVDCKSKDELYARERFHIEANDCVNKHIPLRTKSEYYQDNKEKIKDYKKEYRENNQEQLKEWSSQKCDCECGGKYTPTSKNKHLKTQKHLNYLK